MCITASLPHVCSALREYALRAYDRQAITVEVVSRLHTMRCSPALPLHEQQVPLFVNAGSDAFALIVHSIETTMSYHTIHHRFCITATPFSFARYCIIMLAHRSKASPGGFCRNVSLTCAKHGRLSGVGNGSPPAVCANGPCCRTFANHDSNGRCLLPGTCSPEKAVQGPQTSRPSVCIKAVDATIVCFVICTCCSIRISGRIRRAESWK